MTELKPCPFCGCAVKLDNNREFEDFAGNSFINSFSVIECANCGVSRKAYPKLGYGTTEEQRRKLVEEWNRMGR